MRVNDFFYVTITKKAIVCFIERFTEGWVGGGGNKNSNRCK